MRKASGERTVEDTIFPLSQGVTPQMACYLQKESIFTI